MIVFQMQFGDSEAKVELFLVADAAGDGLPGAEDAMAHVTKLLRVHEQQQVEADHEEAGPPTPVKAVDQHYSRIALVFLLHKVGGRT